MENETKTLICSLCGESIKTDEFGWVGGHNPFPLGSNDDDRCCEKCNWERVIPARLKLFITKDDSHKNN